MPIVVTLDDVLHERRMTLTELADRVGMTLAKRESLQDVDLFVARQRKYKGHIRLAQNVAHVAEGVRTNLDIS